MNYGPLRHYTDGTLDGTVVDPRFGTGATPTQPSGWGGGGSASGPLVSVESHGGIGDGKEAGAGVELAANSTQLIKHGTTTITSADIGRTIWIVSETAGVHRTTLTGVSSVADPHPTGIGGWGYIGTDNGPAITAAINEAKAFGKAGVQFGPGLYLTDTAFPHVQNTRDFRISGAHAGGMSFGIYTANGQPMDRYPGTEVRYLGTGTGKVIDATYTRGFRLDNIAVRVASAQFTGTILDLDYTWASYIDHFVLGGIGYGLNSTVVRDTHTVETQFTDGMIERAAIGFDSRNTPYHANANTYTRVVWLAVDIAMIGPRCQAQFLSCVFEPTGGSENGDPLGDVSPIQGDLKGLTFIGCGWWDARGATAGKGWIEPGTGSSSIVILGGWYGPQNANETLVYVKEDLDGLIIHGMRIHGVAHTSGSKVIRIAPGKMLRNLDYRANVTNEVTTSGLDELTGQVAYSADRQFRHVVALGNVTGSIALRNAASQSLTLTGNGTATFPTLPSGSSMTLDLFVTQDATGSRTLSWPASARHDGGTAPTLNATAGATTHLQATTVNGGATWLVRKVGSYAA